MKEPSYTSQLRGAARRYAAAKKRADASLEFSRLELAGLIEAAHTTGGMSKAEIQRATENVWSRQWIDRLLGPGRRGTPGRGPA